MATSAFGKAFRAAREAGETEFEFGGKKYNTKLKEETSAPSKKTASDSSSSDDTNYGNESRRPVDTPPKDTSSESKSWWTTPNKNLQEGTFPSGKEFRAALGSSYKKGGPVRSSASSRADGIAQRGKTKGRIC